MRDGFGSGRIGERGGSSGLPPPSPDRPLPARRAPARGLHVADGIPAPLGGRCAWDPGRQRITSPARQAELAKHVVQHQLDSVPVPVADDQAAGSRSSRRDSLVRVPGMTTARWHHAAMLRAPAGDVDHGTLPFRTTPGAITAPYPIHPLHEHHPRADEHRPRSRRRCKSSTPPSRAAGQVDVRADLRRPCVARPPWCRTDPGADVDVTGEDHSRDRNAPY